jgi:hypothetical protein
VIDWKQAPAILSNLFCVVGLDENTFRIVFGEKLSERDEGHFTLLCRYIVS